jgi:hypothetical protein
MLITRVRHLKQALYALIVIAFVAAPFSSNYRTEAASYSMKSGYYTGTGVAGHAISGLGFQPDLVIIKSNTTASGGMFKTSAMPATNTAYLAATAHNTASQLVLNSDGFTVGTLAQLNTANALYTWTAYTGSDCSASGVFCVGSYTGNNAATRTITTGFNPGLTIVKRSTSVAAHFRTASMLTNQTEFFTTVAADTAGNYLRSFGATGFDVGITDNVSAATYHYVSFKAGSDVFTEGSYTGDGVDNRIITGTASKPELVLIKNTTSATANNRRSVMSTRQHFGDATSYTADAVVDTENTIQLLNNDGFQIGSSVAVNESGATHYWFALYGASSYAAPSGTYTMATGSYTGTGTTQNFTGLDFAPDLVLIKDDGANHAAFRTKLMNANITAYVGTGSADFAGGITSLDSDGFTIGTSGVINTSGNTYHWQAFGNAYNPITNTGSSDFAIGVYRGNAQDDRSIQQIPFQPDFVSVKRNSNSNGGFRTSLHTGDATSQYTSSGETANVIQSLDANGFSIGTNAVTNTSGSLYRWFAFKSGPSFSLGSYTGNSVDNRQITGVGFSPNLVWVKRITSSVAIQRPNTLTGDTSQSFLNTANVSDRIQAINADGFELGANVDVNGFLGGDYRYMVWGETESVLSASMVDASGSPLPSASFALSTNTVSDTCQGSLGLLGTADQKLRVLNSTTNPAWTLSIAATDGPTALWRNLGNTEQFDFNETSGDPAGCADGPDSDNKAGYFAFAPSSFGQITAKPGCNNTGITLGGTQQFAEGTTDSLTIATASGATQTGCYWDIGNILMGQFSPAYQPADSYYINMTITIVAS